jgi:predicted ATPase/serine/threonine protein kinase/uncharacterized protein HemY
MQPDQLKDQLEQQRQKFQSYQSQLDAASDPFVRDGYLRAMFKIQQNIADLEKSLLALQPASSQEHQTMPLEQVTTPFQSPTPSSNSSEGNLAAVGLTLQPGLLLGNAYRLEKVLGKGGMGEVWLASHVLLNEPRAIKLVLGNFANDTRIRERFIQGEARNALRLQHSNIVRVYDLGQYQGMPYIVMEYIKSGPSGADLKDLLKSEGKFSPERTGEILEQIAAALDVAHRQGLVHRDLKPANLLITEEGQVKVSDFGLVKDLETQTDLTQSNFAMGTPMYMSPEQARGQAEVRSDLYSLGVILYQMLTGRVPFSGPTAYLLVQHATATPEPPHEVETSVPPEISQVILKALEKDPANRYSTALEMAEAYRQALQLHHSRTFEATMVMDSGSIAGATPATPSSVQSGLSATGTGSRRIGPPSGIHTFLFTDIEGSTRLWEHHPEAMKPALMVHDELVRKAIEQNGGYVFKMIGDAFHAVFIEAEAAIKACEQAQRALLNHPWPPEIGAIRVRMALHLAQAENRNGDFVGSGLNRLARLLSAAHGGQVLLSLAVAELVQDKLPAGLELRDLGEHRLKDLIRPEHVFQLGAPALPFEFPPLKSLDAIPNNLPPQLTSFVGREKELEDLKTLLSGKSRIVTLIGTGGTGKTRLSLQVTAEILELFKDGVWQVELASLNDPALLVQEIAQVLGMAETKGKSLQASLSEFLRDKKLLLLLDNCEHLIDACARLVSSLVRSCPNFSVLATSREGLGIQGETTYSVPSLSLPEANKPLPSLEEIAQYGAVRLFVERAETANPKFVLLEQNKEAVVELCRRLDGIPLALELAAVRTRVLTVEQIIARLNDRFKLLTGGGRTALPRQQTLKALIDWSYDLLAEGEQYLWHRLSVFAGGWFLEAAEKVCTGDWVEEYEVLDMLGQLVNKSLVVAQEDLESGQMRYHFLETIRQYGREKLKTTGEEAAVQERHLEYFLELAETNAPRLNGAEQKTALDQLEQEHGNFRAALDFCLATPEQIETGLKLAQAIGEFWKIRSHWTEGREWLAKLLEEAGNNGLKQSSVYAGGLALTGELARLQGAFKEGQQSLEESLALWREFDDKRKLAEVLGKLGILNEEAGQYSAAGDYHREALALYTELKDKAGLAQIYNSLGNVASYQNDHQGAINYFREALGLRRQLKDKRGSAVTLRNLGVQAFFVQNFKEAVDYTRQSLELARELGDKSNLPYILSNLGYFSATEGNYSEALTYYNESLQLLREMNQQPAITNVLINLGNTEVLREDFAAGLEFYQESLQISAELDFKPSICNNLACIARVVAQHWQEKQDPADLILVARLCGATSALRTVIGRRLGGTEQKFYDQAESLAREHLGEEGFNNNFAEGQNLPLSEIITLILAL